MKPSETAAGSAERNLFVHALEKPAGKERVAFLEGACVGKPELRRRLEALLQQFEALGTFLEESVIPPPEAGSTAGAPELLGHTVKIKDTNERMGDKIGDSHAEHWKWIEPNTLTLSKETGYLSNMAVAPNDQDLQKLWQAIP